MEIKQLDEQLIHRANYNSLNGKRGDISKASYKRYVDEVLGWDISNLKKLKILDKLYEKYSEILRLEAQWVSIAVAGPAKYNSKKLDKSDQILEKSHYFYKWFDDLRKQVKNSEEENKETKVKYIVDRIERLMELKLDPTTYIMRLANIDNKKFIELYEKYYPIFRWRKNSNIYKLYQASLAGEVKENTRKVIYEDENFVCYIEGDRAYARFTMKIQRQLLVAFKNRGWWWNSHKKALSTYPSRVNKEWIETISTQYAKYI